MCTYMCDADPDAWCNVGFHASYSVTCDGLYRCWCNLGCDGVYIYIGRVRGRSAGCRIWCSVRCENDIVSGVSKLV